MGLEDIDMARTSPDRSCQRARKKCLGHQVLKVDYLCGDTRPGANLRNILASRTARASGVMQDYGLVAIRIQV